MGSFANFGKKAAMEKNVIVLLARESKMVLAGRRPFALANPMYSHIPTTEKIASARETKTLPTMVCEYPINKHKMTVKIPETTQRFIHSFCITSPIAFRAFDNAQ